MDELLREVRRSTNYYQSQLTDPANSNLPAGITAETGGGAVSKIIMTGGSARMRGLEAYMSARLGLPVEVWNVFDNPALDTTAFAPSFLAENAAVLTTGIGLALKDMTAKHQAVPSRPRRERRERGVTAFRRHESQGEKSMPSINLIAARRAEKRRQEQNIRKLVYGISAETGRHPGDRRA